MATKILKNGPRRADPLRPKLGVYTTREMMRRLHREKADTELTIEDIVNRRLALSYQAHPAPLREPAAAS